VESLGEVDQIGKLKEESGKVMKLGKLENGQAFSKSHPLASGKIKKEEREKRGGGQKSIDKLKTTTGEGRELEENSCSFLKLTKMGTAEESAESGGEETLKKGQTEGENKIRTLARLSGKDPHQEEGKEKGRVITSGESCMTQQDLAKELKARNPTWAGLKNERFLLHKEDASFSKDVRTDGKKRVRGMVKEGPQKTKNKTAGWGKKWSALVVQPPDLKKGNKRKVEGFGARQREGKVPQEDPNQKGARRVLTY